MASDRFANRSSGLADPADDAFAVTPSDSVDFASVARALQVGTGGDVVVVMVSGAVVKFTVQDGAILPVRCKRVNNTNTTASGIVGLV